MNKIIFLMFLLVICNPHLQGQEISVEEINYKSGANLIQSLKDYDDKGTLSSYERSSPFQVKYFLYSQPTSLSPIFYSSDTFYWDNKCSLLYRQDRNQSPVLLLMNDKCFRMLESGSWHVSNDLFWEFRIDFSTDNVLSLLVGKEGNKSNNQIKPFEFIAAHSIGSNGGEAEFKYFQAARGIHFKLKNKRGNINLKFRTPSDQILFGYPLESLWMNEKRISKIKEGSKYELLFCLNSIVAGKKQYCLSPFPEFATQHEKYLPTICYLDDGNRKNKKYTQYGDALKTKKQLLCSDLLRKAIASHGRNKTKDKNKNEDIIKECEKLIVSLQNKLSKNNHSRDAGQSKVEDEDQFKLVVNLLHNLALQSQMQCNSQRVAIQDPFMNRYIIDSCCGDTQIENMCDLLVDVFLSDDNTLEHQEKYVLHEALAKMGYPKSNIPNTVLLKARKSALVDALYLVRSGPPGWLETHTETIKRVEQKIAESEAIEMTLSMLDHDKITDPLHDDFITFNNAIVEILMFMDEVNEMHDNTLRIWFKTKIIDTLNNERFMNLSNLTLQPSGRRYLLTKLEQGNLGAELRNDIIKHLEARLEATVKTKRYDFMSKQECKRIRKVIGSKI